MNSLLASINRKLEDWPIFPLLDKLGKLAIFVSVVSFVFAYHGNLEKENEERALAEKARIEAQEANLVSKVSGLEAQVFEINKQIQSTFERHRQAWLILNTAESQSASGGRIEALETLVKDGISLDRVKLDNAYLNFVKLDSAWLLGASLDGASLGNASLVNVRAYSARARNTNFNYADLSSAYFAGADLSNSSFHYTELTNTNLNGANLEGAKNLPCHALKNAKFWELSYRDSDLQCGASMPNGNYVYDLEGYLIDDAGMTPPRANPTKNFQMLLEEKQFELDRAKLKLADFRER